MMAAEMRWVQWGIHLVGPPSYVARCGRSRGVGRFVHSLRLTGRTRYWYAGSLHRKKPNAKDSSPDGRSFQRSYTFERKASMIAHGSYVF